MVEELLFVLIHHPQPKSLGVQDADPRCVLCLLERSERHPAVLQHRPTPYRVYRRIDATDPRRGIGDVILRKHAATTQVQEELVALGKRVAETEVAQKLRETLESKLADPKPE
jgi:hypothetical protein